MNPSYIDLCIMCDCENPEIKCDACMCYVCNNDNCLTKTDGYSLCKMCAYEKKKSVQDK